MRELRGAGCGIALGIAIIFPVSDQVAFAAREPVIRVFVKENNLIRLRADGNIPLLVTGASRRLKRLKSVNLKFNNNQFMWDEGKGSNNWSKLRLGSSLKVRSSDPRGIWLGNRRYRGELRVNTKNRSLVVVNHLGIEKYLMSVVGSEMPKDWPMAALQAQAVAARTYALKRLGKNNIFDINSSESSQVYLGIEAETKRTIQAVRRTRSLVLKHEGKLISAVFHSSSGGQTERSGDVWKYQLPYLKSVRDYDQNNPKFRWKTVFEQAELKRIFPGIGGVNSIQVLKKSKTGRVQQTNIYGPSGKISISGNELRRRLGLKSTLAKFEMLPNASIERKNKSRASSFSLKSLPKAPKEYSLLVTGLGSGHGVGMSQWGANGLAKKGANFRQILNHYYHDVKILTY
ncbi:SpoIID/LytB domain-containing protein [Prochlorococcus sp. MIT 1223]|uniref:SpoIID/LytB domain-containing protein n=1 Tax=Prochlorococcus sp. MIT 1223 TaxID=3096217 RepID=UPI002A75567F|nr:SpoIID/LytB domain-containing protein [Prochlorococcus sp. MIT 1223]